MRTDKEFELEKSKLVDFIVENLGYIPKQKLKDIFERELLLSSLTSIYALTLESKVLNPENSIQNVVTTDTITELREQINQVQTDLIMSIESLEKKINELKKK